jgi:hypothetical protein
MLAGRLARDRGPGILSGWICDANFPLNFNVSQDRPHGTGPEILYRSSVEAGPPRHGPPTLAVPCDAWFGCAFSQVTSSFKSFANNAFLATISSGFALVLFVATTILRVKSPHVLQVDNA